MRHLLSRACIRGRDATSNRRGTAGACFSLHYTSDFLCMVYTSPLPHRDPVPEVLRSFGKFLLGLEGVRCRLKNHDVSFYLRARLE